MDKRLPKPPVKAVLLNQSPPPPSNLHTGRHPSHSYMVDPALLYGNYSTNRTNPGVHTYGQSRINSTTPEPQPSRVRLEQPVKGPRALNEYVDTPHRKQTDQVIGHKISRHESIQPLNESVIQSQPMKGLNTEKTNFAHEHQNSIICNVCHKCRCEECRMPRDLPKTWICDQKCEVSADKLVEYCTCLCCVQCVFQFMFTEQEDDLYLVDRPCACFSEGHCCKRWTVMGLMSLCLPGLCCYPCLKGCVKCMNKCYNKCTNNGCQCNRDRHSGMGHLLESESSST